MHKFQFNLSLKAQSPSGFSKDFLPSRTMAVIPATPRFTIGDPSRSHLTRPFGLLDGFTSSRR
ncbi:hypothetical protein [Phaeodactylibacter xiamenensis]|uniref:hypothetical protein n=1 Tax=Phaeodactylibacter xiamenensis TaxID=1524460 RepID=UPI0024A93327|nr:hypothetical protein [Phaeodactylibacter xiamenensis]